MSGDTTAAKQITISLGNVFETGTSYTVRSIAMDASGAPVSNETVSTTVTFFDTPGDISVSLTSSASTLTATVDMTGADVSGDPIAHFLVQVVNTDLNGGVTSGIGKVDRTANATSQNVINADASFSGVDFETGDNVKVTVTPFSSVAGAGAEKSGTTTLSAKPNPFALTVNQPVSAAPSVPSFTFAAVDSTPIDGEAITGLSLTISQTDVSDQVIDLFNDHSGNWSAPTFSALTIAHGSNGITLNAGNEISLSFVSKQCPRCTRECSNFIHIQWFCWYIIIHSSI